MRRRNEDNALLEVRAARASRTTTHGVVVVVLSQIPPPAHTYALPRAQSMLAERDAILARARRDSRAPDAAAARAAADGGIGLARSPSGAIGADVLESIDGYFEEVNDAAAGAVAAAPSSVVVEMPGEAAAAAAVIGAGGTEEPGAPATPGRALSRADAAALEELQVRAVRRACARVLCTAV